MIPSMSRLTRHAKPNGCGWRFCDPLLFQLFSYSRNTNRFEYFQCGGVTKEHYRQMVLADEKDIAIQVTSMYRAANY